MTIWPALLLACCLSVAQVAGESDEANVVARWKAIEANARELVRKLIAWSYRDALQLVHEADLSGDCFISLTSALRGLQELKSDVVKMVDASGKIPSGFSEGSLAELGDYDMCLRVSVHKGGRPSAERLFRGQYCSFTLDPPHPPRPTVIRNTQSRVDTSTFDNYTVVKEAVDLSWGLYTTRLRIGICVPDQCSAPEVDRILQSVAAKFLLNTTLLSCEVDAGTPLNTSQIVTIAILGIFVVVVLTATICDMIVGYLLDHGSCDEKPSGSLKAFLTLSLPKATSAVFKVGDSKSRLKVFNGMRTLGVFWVVTFHTYVYPDIGTYQALRELQRNAVYLPYQFVNNAWLCVDMFFFISGFLIVYNHRKISAKTNLFHFYVRGIIQRYWRLIPLALLVMLILFLEPQFGSGPIWKEKIGIETRNCELRWWSLLGGFSNFFAVSDLCIVHFWYISADLQIYGLVTALSLLATRKPRLAVSLMVAVLVVSMAAVGLQTYLSEYPPTIFLFSRDTEFALTMNRWVYLLPHTHLGPYVLGSLTAFAYERYQETKISTLKQAVLWAMALLFTSASLFGAAPWGLGDLPSTQVTVAYATTHRVAWTLGLAWIVFACATGRGGVINSLLSWDALVPLGRLSYSTYLVHAFFVFYKAWTIRQRIENQHFQIMSSAVSNFVMATFGGYLVHVFLERPLVLAWDTANNWTKKPRTDAASHGGAVSLTLVAEPTEAASPHPHRL